MVTFMDRKQEVVLTEGNNLMAYQGTYLLADIFKTRSYLKEVALVLGASVIIGLSAPLAVPLPFTPVPIVVQSHVVLLMSLFLGSRLAPLAVLALIAQCAIGLPVLSQGKFGMAALMGPTAGYVFGWVLASYLTGSLIEKAKHQPTKTKVFSALAIGNAAIYLLGLPWLAVFVGIKYTLFLGLIPFLVGDVLKILFSIKALELARFFKKG